MSLTFGTVNPVTAVDFSSLARFKRSINIIDYSELKIFFFIFLVLFLSYYDY